MDTSLLRSLRKALKNKPLDPDEQCIFEHWQSEAPNADLIFERAAPDKAHENKDVLKQAVSMVQSTEQLRSLFEKLFATAPDGQANTDSRRALPVVQFSEEDDPANLETSAGVVAAHFELRELDDLIPSHDPLNQFKKRDDYPEGVQERPYHSDNGEQDKVRRNAAHLNPRYLINTNPDAMTGPPCITSNGIVLGGNSRTMSMQLAYAVNPEKAAKYKETLAKMAFSFGFTKEQVEKMKKPVLVRVVNKSLTNEEMAQASRRFNEVSTQALQLDAEGVSKSKLVSQRTMGILQANFQEFDTLREYLGSRQSLPLISALADDGVIEQMQLSRITNNEGLLNSEGKELVEAVLRGLIVPDYDLIRRSPAGIMNKVDRAIPALAQLKSRGGEWDISDLVAKALSQINKTLGCGMDLKDIGLYFAQSPLVPDADFDNKGIQALAITLAKATPKELAARLNAFAADSQKMADGGGMLMASAVPSAEKSFAKAFLRTVATVGNVVISNFNPEKDEKHAALEWAAHASKSHTIEAASNKLGALIDSLDTPEEEREEAKRKDILLRNYDGVITIYKPNLGDLFAFSSANGDTLLKRG